MVSDKQMPSVGLRPSPGAELVASTVSREKSWDRKAVYLDSSTHANGETELLLPAHVSLQVEPTRVKDARDVIFVSGRSFSGKSYWAARFCEAYHALHPERPIVLLSALAEDKNFDSLGYVRRLRVDSLIDQGPLQLSEFPHGGLLIVDDVEGCNKAQEAAIEATLTTVLTMGRHAKLSCLVLKHLASDYRKTRLLLHESHMLVLFPAGCAASQMSHVLSYHAGLDKEQIKRLRKLPSRWVAVRTTYPGAVFYEGGCYLANSKD